MRGTGSNTYVGEDVFVPEHRLIPVTKLSEGSTGSDEPVHRLPFAPIATLALVGTLLGLGRAALALAIDKAPSKSMHHTFFARQSDSVGVQVQVAEAALSYRPLSCMPTASPMTWPAQPPMDTTWITGSEPGREPSSATRPSKCSTRSTSS
jgi:hypothetical protein